jgi:hypothetical protein
MWKCPHIPRDVKDRKAPRGLSKVEKCKLNEIVPKKPKFAGRGP